ncbi:MAG: hypothetical protein IPL73_21675 [Candidatus Obscuribacter sp.]|nr:hypothetical protein [Candidatus Obscuribacter sp.]
MLIVFIWFASLLRLKRASDERVPLSADERRCLAMWFRQAIAKLELEEVTQVMLKEYPPEETEVRHRAVVARRRARTRPNQVVQSV